MALLETTRIDHIDRIRTAEMMCRSHASTGNDNYYVSRTPDIVIDVHDPKYPLDIPDFDTSRYGWLRQGDTEV